MRTLLILSSTALILTATACNNIPLVSSGSALGKPCDSGTVNKEHMEVTSDLSGAYTVNATFSRTVERLDYDESKTSATLIADVPLSPDKQVQTLTVGKSDPGLLLSPGNLGLSDAASGTVTPDTLHKIAKTGDKIKLFVRFANPAIGTIDTCRVTIASP